MNYYGGLSEGVDALSQELLADISHFSFNTVRDGKFITALPVSVRLAMLHLSKELQKLAPLAIALDDYMQGEAEVEDVVEHWKSLGGAEASESKQTLEV